MPYLHFSPERTDNAITQRISIGSSFLLLAPHRGLLHACFDILLPDSDRLLPGTCPPCAVMDLSTREETQPSSSTPGPWLDLQVPPQRRSFPRISKKADPGCALLFYSRSPCSPLRDRPGRSPTFTYSPFCVRRLLFLQVPPHSTNFTVAYSSLIEDPPPPGIPSPT